MEIKINELSVFSEKSITFSEAMSMAGLSFRKPCGGQGRCLRCGIRFDYGAPMVTEADDRAYDHKELNDGWRLGCGCALTRDCKIFVPDHLYSEIESETVASESAFAISGDMGVAVDIGTTTVAVAVVELESGRVIGTSSRANSQAEYGADVMSRIDAACMGKSDELASRIREDVESCIGEIVTDFTNVKRMVFSGNTAMLHLLFGYPTKGLRAFPFKPFSLDGINTVFHNTNTLSFPGISAFVGGDIVAGLYELGVIDSGKKSIFLDLGTNAEVALWDGNRLFVTSSSAGPALEGGNLSCGLPSVKGAISHVKISPSHVAAVETIGGVPSVGICGSGIIDAIYEMRKAGVINDKGLFIGNRDSFTIGNNATITAKDIEQVILCKSAIYASIEVLLKEAGVDVKDIEKLYVAGGLGTSIDKDSAAGLGIFPRELSDKFEAVGNTSLKGAIKLLKTSDIEACDRIVKKAVAIELSNHPDFEKCFLENLKI